MTQLEMVRTELLAGKVISPDKLGISKQSVSAIVSTLRKKESLSIETMGNWQYRLEGADNGSGSSNGNGKSPQYPTIGAELKVTHLELGEGDAVMVTISDGHYEWTFPA